MKHRLQVNGSPREVDAEPDKPLLWVLRDDLRLTGTKYGCGVAQCGACTVHLGGQPVRSCSVPVALVGERPVVTVEGAQGRVAGAVRAAWLELQVPQCGYCQSGQIMTAINLLTEIPKPTDADIDGAFAGNICRCGTYQRVRAAVHKAAQSVGG
ncbi:MAG TPA: (2Fe-2S)-binding protein [Polyangiaceae bacterium]|nr:(2Fe-2S)-binding protein [Polyangiaceae bacterium]